MLPFVTMECANSCAMPSNVACYWHSIEFSQNGIGAAMSRQPPSPAGGANLCCNGAANSSPPPCGEGSGVGVEEGSKTVPRGTTPHPNPPPQGGRESLRHGTA